jgi:hypothetical protein
LSDLPERPVRSAQIRERREVELGGTSEALGMTLASEHILGRATEGGRPCRHRRDREDKRPGRELRAPAPAPIRRDVRRDLLGEPARTLSSKVDLDERVDLPLQCRLVGEVTGAAPCMARIDGNPSSVT